MKELYEAAKVMNDNYEKTLHMPIRIKVNKQWWNKQLENGVITVSESNRVSNFIGMPVEVDDTIETFKWVYRDEYQEYLDKLEKELFNSAILPMNYFK
jgi:hypothetical protein